MEGEKWEKRRQHEGNGTNIDTFSCENCDGQTAACRSPPWRRKQFVALVRSQGGQSRRR